MTRTRTRQRASHAEQTFDSKEGVKSIKRTLKVGGDSQSENKQERIREPLIEGPVAYVRVSAGETLQPRDFESVRVDVSLSLPCAPTKKGIAQAYEKASEWVGETLAEEKRLALEAMGFESAGEEEDEDDED